MNDYDLKIFNFSDLLIHREGIYDRIAHYGTVFQPPVLLFFLHDYFELQTRGFCPDRFSTKSDARDCFVRTTTTEKRKTTVAVPPRTKQCVSSLARRMNY